MPEIGPGSSEADSDVLPFSFLSYGRNKALHRFVGHLVIKTHGLAGREPFCHHDERPIGAYSVCGRFQIDGIAFGRLAANSQGDL